ncbi:polyhydroxyalkanoic acid system family protein [Thiocapsa marina]|uniref:Polyhydroxyalkanoic acid system protein n=1 Tax=Thiocapsa marina 5811 TaxID=768671 RepID=F9UGC4_9GAMM|nr:polyhydroxyalkanoic acid system family protein [Thiocapsa marina]EGV16850.1 polyhydroxyalkanoic acid system protein [Thiocapsa marina 5811]
MADIFIEREHTLGLDRALEQVATLAGLLVDELDARCAWNGNRLDFTRPGASGRVEVTETLLILEVSLGFLLRPFKDRIEQGITEKLDSLVPCLPSV